MPNPVVLIVGRLSGPKNDVILRILREVAPRVVAKFPAVRFQVVGGPVAAEHRALQEEFPWVRFEGHQSRLVPYYGAATLVIGAGRVALEAMSLQKPVVAVGERRYIGPLAPPQVEAAKATNFGDCWGEEAFDWDRMGRDILRLLGDKGARDLAAQTGYELVRTEYAMDGIFPRMEELYRRTLLEKNLASFHELPVLMYHRVVEKLPAGSKYNLHILREDLERQLRFLQNHGFTPTTFEDLTARRVPKKPIILTFDDGYEDNHRNLFPLLKKYRMKAVVFLLGDRRHKDNFWDVPQGEPAARLLKPGQIRQMAASGLVEFGAHSLNHVRLTRVGPREARKEVEGSKRELERFLKKPVVSFAYPYGDLNEETKKTVREAGYTFGIAVQKGPSRFADDLMEIRRVHMFPDTSWIEYWKKTSGFYLRYRKLLGK